MNRTIIRIICPHPERIEITFKDGTVLEKEFPGLPVKFYRYQIIDSLAGARWYR